jgi:hypothetical protein
MPPGKKIDNTAAAVKSTGLRPVAAVAVATTAATTTTPAGFTGTAQADAIVANLNAVIADEANTKAVLSALIDELSARGVL